MKLIRVSLILGLLFISLKGRAQGDFTSKKADDIARVTEQIAGLTEYRDCLKKASGNIALQDCHKNNRVRSQNIHKKQRESMHARQKKEIEDRCTHIRIRSKRNISMERCVQEQMQKMRRHRRDRRGKGRGDKFHDEGMGND